MPQAPIFVSETSGRAASQSKTSLRVRDLARAVDPDEAAGLAVPARVEGQHGVVREEDG